MEAVVEEARQVAAEHVVVHVKEIKVGVILA